MIKIVGSKYVYPFLSIAPKIIIRVDKHAWSIASILDCGSNIETIDAY